MIPAFSFWKNVDFRVLITADYDRRKEKLKNREKLVYGQQLHVVDRANEECYNGSKFSRIIHNSYNLSSLQKEAEDLLNALDKNHSNGRGAV
jgi:dephospho-CoA kinase